ncbi:MAG: CopG family antitoxin [Caldilineaceae bacterium]
MPKLPIFQSEEELAAWIETHDTASYIDQMEDADEIFNVQRSSFPTRPIDVRLRSDYLAAIEAVAEQRGIPYQMLIQAWLLEKLRQEAPEMLPQT